MMLFSHDGNIPFVTFKSQCLLKNKNIFSKQEEFQQLWISSSFFFIIISVQFPNFIFYTQDTAMHNSKFKKSIASTTIKNSLSKTSQPHHRLVRARDGGKSAEVSRMDQQFFLQS